jgi:dephospho-CoA kinase
MTVWKIGLTGGIGSGKSTVAAHWVERGATLIDADAISRSVTAPGGAGIEAIRQAFGAVMIDADGAMDRTKMRTLIFSNLAAKQRLERIIHPLVAQENARMTAYAIANGASCLVFDIPLLVESKHWRTQLDAVVVVDCDAETQVQRVMARSGYTRDAVLAVTRQQATRAQRLAAADVVLVNKDISLVQLYTDVDQIAVRFGLLLGVTPRNFA